MTMADYPNIHLVYVCLFLTICMLQSCCVSGAYYGKLIGSLTPIQHEVSGKVYAASSTRLYITEFRYDGEGPDAFASMGSSASPSSDGVLIPVDGRSDRLPPYRNGILKLELPSDTTLSDYKWLSIWSTSTDSNFGDITIPSDFDVPAPKSLGSLGYTPLVHRVYADDVIILNTRQLELVNLDYDGNGPDTYYWAGSGSTPSRSGFALADESRGGSTDKLPRTPFEDKTLTVTIPGDKPDLFNIGNVGMWCVMASQSFGHIQIPSQLNVPPYDEPGTGGGSGPFVPLQADNCKVLIDDTYQVRWTVKESVLEVALSARIEPGTYMAFGLSGSDSKTTMVGSDVTVAWLDAETGVRPSAVDYYLSAYQQCVTSSDQGACPDTASNPVGTNDVTLKMHSYINGIITISYTKLLDTSDTASDKVIPTDREVYVAWGIGPINPSGRAAKHRQVSSSNVKINFGQPESSCPLLSTKIESKLDPWIIVDNLGKDGTTTFTVDIGQSGGQQGYEGITGLPGWGIGWYVNNYLVPVLTVKRGVKYTFIVNGGEDENNEPNYHPFYITDDKVGGYVQKNEQEKQGVKIFAGPVTGSLCDWSQTGLVNPDDFKTFEDYRDSALERQCVSDNPGKLIWTPDKNTPDVVYYQCYTHEYLGWKINVVGSGSVRTSVSLAALVVSLLLTMMMV